MSMVISTELESLIGLNIDRIEGLSDDSDKVTIITKCGKSGIFYHEQDCCESVYLSDFIFSGSKPDGALIISAEIETSSAAVDCGHETWSFYKINTTKGELWMRWIGESNGYYSEDVDFCLVENDEI